MNPTVEDLRERLHQLQATRGPRTSRSWLAALGEERSATDWVGRQGAGPVGENPDGPTTSGLSDPRLAVTMARSPVPAGTGSGFEASRSLELGGATSAPSTDREGALSEPTVMRDRFEAKGPLGGVIGTLADVTRGVAPVPLTPFRETELWGAAEELGRLGQYRDLLLARVVGELRQRGSEHPGGLSLVDALRAMDRGLSAAQAKAIVIVGEALTQPQWSELAASVGAGGVSVAKAALIVEFRTRLQRVADPAELDAAVTDLTDRACIVPLEQLRTCVRHHTETISPPSDLDALDAGRRSSRGLWFDRPCTNGMVTGRFTLDPEGAAVVKAAIDPLAAPRPTLDGEGRTVERDPRTPATRRADALLEVIGRGVSSPGAAPSTDRAKVVVTIDLPVLEGRLSGAGLTLTGEVLSPATVRRIACDAEALPVVLGTAGQPLDVGRSHRLVPFAIRQAAWIRDRGCTYPGCTIPATWCDAHHVTHWIDGGDTSLANTALLCGRHHTIVHQRGLTASVTATAVTWHL